MDTLYNGSISQHCTQVRRVNMVTMIPQVVESFNSSQGEEMVYESLSQLNDSFVVFHSVGWNTKRYNRLVQGEGDFVVYVPSRGLIVIEVKSSDIRVSQGSWYQTNRSTGEEHLLRRSPLSQADDTKFELIRLLKKHNIDMTVISAVWFPTVDNVMGDLSHHLKQELMFLRKDLRNVNSALERAFNFCGFDDHYKDDLLTKRIIDVVSPKFDAFSTGQGLITDYNYIFNRMTDEQTRVLDFLVEQKQAKIVGGAGTGKTIIAIEQAKRLSEDGKVLFLCYNSFLLDDLRTRTLHNKNIDVHNPFSLFLSYVKNSKLNIEDLDSDVLCNFLLEMNYTRWKYKHIIIDEGQDLDSDFILLLKGLTEEDDSGFFYVFYDLNQTVHNRGVLKWTEDIQCQLVLSTNCRNTQNIAKTSHSVLDLKGINIRSDVIGDKSKFYFSENLIQLKERLGTEIKRYLSLGYRLDDITILTLKTMEKSLLSGIQKVGNYSLSIDEKIGRSILFTTARKFKGLESNIVLIVDIDEELLKDQERSMLFYVATSRAKVILDIFYCGSNEKFDTFVKAANIDGKRFPRQEFFKRYNLLQDR